MKSPIATCSHPFNGMHICPSCGLTRPEAAQLYRCPIPILEAIQARIIAEEHLADRIQALLKVCDCSPNAGRDLEPFPHGGED